MRRQSGNAVLARHDACMLDCLFISILFLTINSDPWDWKSRELDPKAFTHFTRTMATWESCNLSMAVRKTLDDFGFVSMTPVQVKIRFLFGVPNRHDFDSVFTFFRLLAYPFF